MTDPTNCCAPGDFTVTPVHGGFMIGRALPERGAGPWWEYLKVVRGLREAVSVARQMATAAHTYAWFHEGGSTYIPIPLDPSKPFMFDRDSL